MRLHIELDDELVAQVDQVAGPRGRSAFVRECITAALRDAQRAALLRSAAGALTDTTHAWDVDPGTWVREQRHRDGRRAG